MEYANRWYFTKEILENTPSRKCGIEASKELSYRQQAANFIQDMGQRLTVTQLCINTAIVYMHRFYMFHSFMKFHRNHIAVAALFLAAKVEEQPRKIEHVIRVAHKCLHRGEDLDPKSEPFMSKCNDLVYHENVMLQTLGFDIGIEHPHTYVVKLLQLVKASKDLAQTSYFMATNSLHLTTMCLQYRPTLVACVCIHLACKWSNWKIEPCSEGKEWYYYVDKSTTLDELEDLTKDFLAVLEKSPNRLKRRIGPDNNKDGHTQFKAGDDVMSRLETLPYDNCLDSLRKELSPTPSTSDDAIMELISTDKMLEPVVQAIAPVALPPTPKSPPKRSEFTHSMSLAVYREKHEKKLKNIALEKDCLPEQKASAPALPEMPSNALLHRNPWSVSTNKHSTLPVSVQEKRHHKSKVTSNELVPKRNPDKTNVHKPAVSHGHLEATSNSIVNHQILRTSVPDVDFVPVDSHMISRTNPAKTVPPPHETSKSGDPYVLLTRVDDSLLPPPAEKLKPHLSKSPLSDFKPDLKRPPVWHPSEKALPVTAQQPFVNTCDNSSVTKLSESHHAELLKHPKMKAPLPVGNNHADSYQPLTQGVIHHKQATIGSSAKANGSKVPELTVVDQRVNAVPPEQSKANNKTGVHKQERREKHRHKHSDHYSKDKSSSINNNFSLKIKFSRTSETAPLKIKLPVPEAKPVPQQEKIKLVLAKDKKSGSYSATHKVDKTSRKRSISPSSKDQKSHSYTVKSKYRKEDRSSRRKSTFDGAGMNNCTNNPAAHLSDVMLHQNALGFSQELMFSQNNVAQLHQPQQPFMTQYGAQPCYSQYYHPYGTPQPPMHYIPAVPMPPHAESTPPLPRDPPPPLPPQPPLPTE